MGYRLEKFKDLFRSKEFLLERENKEKTLKNKLDLENKSNNFIKTEMYDLYAQMISSGYQPTKEQEEIISKKIIENIKSNSKEGFTQPLSQLFENNYNLSYMDICELMLDDKFMNSCYSYFANEEDNNINNIWKGLPKQILNHFNNEKFIIYSCNAWLEKLEKLIEKHDVEKSLYYHEIYPLKNRGLKSVNLSYDIMEKKWKKYIKPEIFNDLILKLKETNKPVSSYHKENNGNESIVIELIDKLTKTYKEVNSYEINQIMNNSRIVFSGDIIEKKTKDLVEKNNNFKINLLSSDLQKIIIEIENNCEKLSKIKDVEIQFIVTNTMDKVLPETIKKYFTIDEEYRETLKNHQGKSAKDFFVESLMNMNDKLNELLVTKNESGLRDMAINATYTRNIKNN